MISIHPPRMGWDRGLAGYTLIIIIFQSTHPAWGGTIKIDRGSLTVIDFNPPTPHGVGRGRCYGFYICDLFQSTHPAWGGTELQKTEKQDLDSFQSTHPAWGGTHRVPLHYQDHANFNPPTPHGVGLVQSRAGTRAVDISIHPPRMGWDIVGARIRCQGL